jgi:hypothetical protein
VATAAMPPLQKHARRSLLPREHGAYGQLALPLATALALVVVKAGVTVSSIALSVSSVAAFLAHEPLLVVVGLRGSRAHREDGERARRFLLGAGFVAFAAGVVAFVFAPALARVSLVASLALVISLLPLIARRRERSLVGELVAATALSSVSLPILLAASVPLRAALTVFGIWAASFASCTLVIRGVLVHARGDARSRLRLRALAPVVVLASGAALAALGVIEPTAAMALLPLSLASLGLAVFPPPAKRIRAVGWSVVAAGAFTFLMLVVGIRI